MTKRWLWILLAAVLSVSLTGVSAQGESDGTLTAGLPAVGQVQTAGDTLRYDYTLSEARQVTLQVLSDSAKPTVTILRDGAVVAAEMNAGGVSTVTLTTLLDAGAYVVEVGTTNGTFGLVVLNVQSETPITITPLTAGSLISGAVSASAPLALYRFDALAEPAYLYVESQSDGSGVGVQVVNVATGGVVAQSSADVLGARFRFGAGSTAYQIEISASGAGASESFTLCLSTLQAGGCEGQAAPAPSPTTTLVPTLAVAPTAESSGCTVTPNVSSGVNIRQSATTSSVVLGSLPGVASAPVLGISPDGGFYNILYNAVNGWVSITVVNTQGDCGSLAVVNPPPVVAPPTLPPPPTAAPTQPPPPTPSGPCLITLTSPTFIYQIPNDDISYLQDQVQAGELIPTGRLADNTWWKTNYANAWISTSTFGVTAQVSGDCRNLPVIAAP